MWSSTFVNFVVSAIHASHYVEQLWNATCTIAARRRNLKIVHVAQRTLRDSCRSTIPLLSHGAWCVLIVNRYWSSLSARTHRASFLRRHIVSSSSACSSTLSGRPAPPSSACLVAWCCSRSDRVYHRKRADSRISVTEGRTRVPIDPTLKLDQQTRRC